MQDSRLIYRNLLLFYTLIINYLKEKAKKKISLTIISKRRKNLEVKLTKEVKDLYSENYETLMKKTEDNTNKWKDILCSSLEELILLKWR